MSSSLELSGLCYVGCLDPDSSSSVVSFSADSLRGSSLMSTSMSEVLYLVPSYRLWFCSLFSRFNFGPKNLLNCCEVSHLLRTNLSPDVMKTGLLGALVTGEAGGMVTLLVK